MAKLMYEDLERVRDKTAAEMALRLGSATVTVTVHMGTCGIAAGARDVMKALMQELAATERQDIRVLAAGCLGKCASEPNLTVALQGSEPVAYQKMDPAKIKQVFERHVLAGEIQDEFRLR
jgi:NADP-reducing hydrogenase subunit HndB